LSRLADSGEAERSFRREAERLVKGKRVTGFTNGEEEAVHLTKVVPFPGGVSSPWAVHVDRWWQGLRG
jgi:hypothetical protein